MPKLSNKAIHLLISIVIIIVVTFLSPDTGKAVESFQSNYEKSTYFESCLSDTGTTTSEYLDVVEVVDGDTLHVSKNCKAETVRLLGINTPETVDPRKPVECFGKEASAFAKSYLKDKKVKIETDSSQGEKDKFGRVLGYIILEDGTNFNKLMLEQGYAYEYTYGKPYIDQADFKAAQKDAETNERGLWSPETCNGSK